MKKSNIIILILSLIIVVLASYIIYDKINDNKKESKIVLNNFNINNIKEVIICLDNKLTTITKQDEITNILYDIDISLKVGKEEEISNEGKDYLIIKYNNEVAIKIIFIDQNTFIINYPFNGYTKYILKNSNYLNNLKKEYS